MSTATMTTAATPDPDDDDLIEDSARRWAAARNGNAPVAPAAPAFAMRGVPGRREPDRLAGFTPDGLEEARRAGVDVRGMAAADLAALSPPGVHTLTRVGAAVRFERVLAEIVARERAALRSIAETGELPDPGEQDREASAEMIRAWWRSGLGLAGLVGAARAAADHYRGVVSHREERLARFTEEAYANGGGPLVHHCRRASGLASERDTARERLGAIEAALAALPAALVARLTPAVATIGGPGRLATQLREAAAVSGSFPGPDPQLDRLHLELDEAARLMRDLNPPDDEDEGELYATARARRDELVEAAAARESIVKRAASDAIKADVAAALEGDLGRILQLLATFEAKPEAFPESFRLALAAAPLESAIAAGAVGFALAL